MIGVYLWAGFCADVPMDSRKEGDDLLMAKQTFCLAPCSLHLMRAMQTAPAFLPLFLAVLRFEGGGEREQVKKTLPPLISSPPFAPKPCYFPHLHFPPSDRSVSSVLFAFCSLLFFSKISLDYLSEFRNSMEHATDRRGANMHIAILKDISFFFGNGNNSLQVAARPVSIFHSQ